MYSLGARLGALNCQINDAVGTWLDVGSGVDELVVAIANWVMGKGVKHKKTNAKVIAFPKVTRLSFPLIINDKAGECLLVLRMEHNVPHLEQ